MKNKTYKDFDIISFVYYRQWKNIPEDKDATAPIDWLVLDIDIDIEKGKILLLSKYVLFNIPFTCENAYRPRKPLTWENSLIRSQLNQYFIKNAFTQEEQARIITSTVTPDVNPQNPTLDQGPATQDKIFLLSTTEAECYFKSLLSRSTYQTNYADCFRTSSQKVYWWLRTVNQFRLRCDTTCVLPNGTIDYNGNCQNNERIGVRPAMRIKFTLDELKNK